MKFLNKKIYDTLKGLFFTVFNINLYKFSFLALLLLQPGVSTAQDNNPSVGETQTLDRETQEFVCTVNTNSWEGENICLDDKVDAERVALCYSYTSTGVSEALCLKNKALASANVVKCFIGTPELLEQVCLVGSETTDRIISYFENADADLTEIVKEIENIKTEMEDLLNVYRVRFDITTGSFSFHWPDPQEQNPQALDSSYLL